MFANRLVHHLQRMLMVFVVVAQCALGDITDLATVPLETSSTTSVLPNLMFVLDDSTSMTWTFMPDSVWDANRPNEYGLRTAQCNGVYYNPTFTYAPPVDADGDSYPNANFTAAHTDGFDALSSTVNLSANFRAEGYGGYADISGGAAYYYTYSGSQTSIAQKKYEASDSTFYQECHSNIGDSPGSSVFTHVTVSGAAAQNFANWYSYYRTRMLMMRTAAGQAFRGIDSRFRVGFMAINTNASFLNPSPFDSTQKALWYTKLYTSAPNGETPLRRALANVGRLYAGKLTLSGITVDDPVQYSCQQNFTILSTDGYWNQGEGFQVDGSTPVGNQDGTAPRPYYDGTIYGYLKTTSQSTETQTQVVQTTSQLQSKTTQLQQRTSSLQKQVSQLQQQTNWQQQTAPLQQATSTLQQRTKQAQSQTYTLQETDYPLQTRSQALQQTIYPLQTRTVNNWTQTTTPLQTQTRPLRKTSYPLQTRTVSNWTQTSYPLQMRTQALQQTSYPLQIQTVANWTQTSFPLQTRTQALQQTSYPLQIQTNGVQQQTSQLQQSTKVDGVFGAYVNVSSCTASSTVQCRTVVSVAWTNVPSCTATTTPNGSGQTTQCQYAGWGAWSNAAGTCTAAAQSAGPNYTPAVQCQYAATGITSTVSSCTAAGSLASPYLDLSKISCTYTGTWSAWTNASTCATVGTSGPNYATAVGCQYAASGSTSTVASCAAVAQDATSPYTVPAAVTCAANWGSWGNAAGTCTASATTNCQYAGSGTTTTVPTCTAAGSTSSPYSVLNKVTCGYSGTWSAWTNASTCATVGTSGPNYATAVDCQYTGTGTTATVASCAAVVPDATSPYTVPTAVTCAANWGSWGNAAGTCTASATVGCQYPSSGTTTTVSSCTNATDTSSPYTLMTKVNCSYGSWSGWSNAATCTTVGTAGPNYATGVNCQYRSPTTTTVASCTPIAGSGGSPYTVPATVTCSANWGGWTNATGPCTASATVGCQYAGAGPTTTVASCTPVAGSTGPSYILMSRTGCAYTGTWSAWANTSNCATVGTGGPPYATAVDCQYAATGTTSNVGTCTNVAGSGASPYTVATKTTCGYTAGALTNVSSCTEVPQDTTSPYTVGTAVSCSYGNWGNWANATSACTPAAAATSSPYTAATECRYTGYSAPATVGSCTPVAQDNTALAAVQCSYGSYGAWSNVSACTPVPPSTAPYVATAVQCQPHVGWIDVNASTCPPGETCQTVVTEPFASAASCTATTTPDATTGQTTQCQYDPTWSAWSNVGACAAAQSTGPNYTLATATQCQTADSGWVNASACTSTALDASGQTVSCQTVPIATGPVASCTPSSSGGLTVTCSQATVSGPTGVQSCTPQAPSAGNGDVTTTCATVTTGIPDPVFASSCTAGTADASNNWMTTTCAATNSGGSEDSLSDVAMYYYTSDLRTAGLSNCTGALGGSVDVCVNNVPSTGLDGASWQHMTLFTLGLGANGKMIYSPTYLGDNTGDYPAVKNGTLSNPPTLCSWQAAGQACNWPHPGLVNGTDGIPENIDDLWHAAVNGRGTYFSATDPASLANGISGALSGVAARLGASAATSASTPNMSAGDNYVFSTSFTTQDWSGELIRQQVNLTDGSIPVYDPANHDTYDWTAQSQLDAKVSRTIYYSKAGVRTAFLWGNLTAAEQAYFSAANIASLSQFCATGDTCLSAANKTLAASENLVEFLRGDRSHEGGTADTSKYYRLRSHRLGDMVGSEAVYVKRSVYTYADPGYSDFALTNNTRQSMVYVGSNDGMLHAFNGDTGEESWAFIPSMVLPDLYKLADKNYANLHRYFVDGSPVIGDICSSHCADAATAVWKTILVAGLRGGGRGYYALDISNPSNPIVLWEFTDTNLGYTYGNPVITKLSNGTWTVLFASGYNNLSPGDGVGRLYVLDAATGVLSRTISTSAGDTTTPSGLAQISAWAEQTAVDNTTLRVYGGDLLGNVWRFDVNNTIGTSGYDAQLLANLTDANGNTQPVTGKPELSAISISSSTSADMVYVATGQYLGATDRANVNGQSMYAIKDRLTAESYGHPRDNTCTGGAASCFVQQVHTIGTCPAGMPIICTAGETVRVSTNNPVNLSTGYGWYIDLLDSGERVNTDPLLVTGILVFNSNTPSADSCSMGGYSNQYFVDYRTGGAVSSALFTTGGGTGETATSGTVGEKIANEIASSPVFIKTASSNTGETVSKLSGSSNYIKPVPPSSSTLGSRRLSWRELISE